MELWVRSQNKILFRKVDELTIQEHADMEDFAICSGKYVLGVYKTKNRCLEILDEIQKLICDSDKTLLAFDGYMEMDTYEELMRELDKNKFAMVGCNQDANIQAIPLNTTVVYQMPEK